jgi:ribonuclease VapC
MFVDACAIVAILSEEPDADDYAHAIDDARVKFTSALAAWEAIIVLSQPAKFGRPLSEVENLVCEWLIENEVALEHPQASEREILRLAVHARAARSGRSRPNAFDCFHYAHAIIAQAPILTKDGALRSTDVTTAP